MTDTIHHNPVIASVLNQLTSWLGTNLEKLLGVIVIIVGAIVLIRILEKLFSRVLSRTMRDDMYPSKVDRDRRLQTLNSISIAVITFLVWFIAILMIMSTMGINTGPLLASAGIVSVAIGFGAQSLVKDFITGMFIIAENQYRVGDYVEIQNVKGTVKAVTMRTIIVKDENGNIFHIPNGSIVVTGNHTMSNNKVHIELSTTTETDVDKLRDIVNAVGLTQSKDAEKAEFIIDPIHFLRIKDIISGAIVVQLAGKVRAGKQAVVRSDYLTRLQKELVKNKITLK